MAIALMSFYVAALNLVSENITQRYSWNVAYVLHLQSLFSFLIPFILSIAVYESYSWFGKILENFT